MKRLLLLCIHACLLASASFAQSKKVTYNTLADATEAIPVEMRFKYPDFRQGHVYFIDGSEGMGRLNYNMLVNEMQFINATGDTLGLDGVEKIQLLTIGKDTFYYDKGMVQVIAYYPPAKLAVRDKLKIMDHQKIGAFGMATSTGSIDSYTYLSVNRGRYQLSVNENLVLAKERSYYLTNKENRFIPLTINNLQKVFPNKKSQIKAFVQDERLNLSREEDIFKLLAFCSGT